MRKSAIPLLLVRHGHTEWSRCGRYQGRSDPPLILEGGAQALKLGFRLRRLGIESILTSPLRRACETAELIAEMLGLGLPVVDPRLTEIDYGAWEGLTQTEIRLRWPEQLRRWKDTPDLAPAPGGESLSHIRERLRLFLLDPMWATNRGGGALIVSHSGLIRVALLEASQQPLSMFRRLAVPTGSMRRLALHWDAGKFKLFTPLAAQEPCV